MSNSLMLSPMSALGRQTVESNGESGDQFPYAIAQSLLLIGKVFYLLLLLALFAISFVVWIWVASFRSGWRFGDWVETRDDAQQVSVGILYGFAVLVITPFFLFVDWAQKQFDRVLPNWMKLPSQVPVRQLFEDRLGIKLGEEFPFFIENKKS